MAHSKQRLVQSCMHWEGGGHSEHQEASQGYDDRGALGALPQGQDFCACLFGIPGRGNVLGGHLCVGQVVRC